MSSPSGIITDIVDNLRRIFQILNEQSKKVKKETGLTGPQLWTIKVINENEPINLSDLADRLYLHITTVGGIIDRLEVQSYVKRTRSKDDRRMIWLELTPKGKALVASAPEVAQGLLVAGLEDLSARQLTAIDRSMKRLVKIFGAQQIPVKLFLSKEINLPQGKKSKKKRRDGR